jgi:UDP-4-amino-4-deoxy-L-arabinose-oxoglutarate aminotransferase
MGSRIGWTGTAVFSFHPIKNMTTGEGGMLCTDNKALADKVRRLKFHGLGVDAYDRRMQGRSPQAEVLEPGYKYNMTDISAGLGLRQLSRLDEFNRKRRELADLYLELLRKIPLVKALAAPAYSISDSRHLFIVRLDTDRAGISRDEFMERLKGQNIGTGIHFKAVHLQKFYRENMPQSDGVLLNTE